MRPLAGRTFIFYGGNEMEDMIRQVLQMDEKTKKLVKESEKKLEAEKAETETRLNQLEVEGHEESKQAAIDEYNRVYAKALDEVKEIEEENQRKIDAVDAFYQENKEDLVEKAFRMIIQ